MGSVAARPQPARHRHERRPAGVRWPDHHRADLVQGAADCRSPASRSAGGTHRRRPLRPGRRPRSPASPGWRCASPRCAASRTAEKRIAFVLTNAPGKAARIGNAVGLDAPASLLRILDGDARRPATTSATLPDDGDALIHALIDRCSYDETLLTAEQLANAAGRVPATMYRRWFDELPESQRAADDGPVGPAAGRGLRPRRPHRPGRPGLRQRLRRPAAAARLRHGPERHLPPARPAAAAQLLRPLPLARATSGGPTPSSTWASTARSNGCPARASACRRTASPTASSATCRCSIRSSSTTPARGPRPSGAAMPSSSTT